MNSCIQRDVCEVRDGEYDKHHARLCTEQFDGLDEYWVHDMSLRYETGTWILRGGISNVFDEAPPLTDNNLVRNLAGIGYDLGGRTAFVNVTKSF